MRATSPLMRWDLCRGTKALEIDGAQAHFYSASSTNIGAICWQESRMCIDGSASDYACTGFAKRFGRSVQTSQILTVLSTKRVLFNGLTCVGLVLNLNDLTFSQSEMLRSYNETWFSTLESNELVLSQHHFDQFDYKSGAHVSEAKIQ